jgi:hypothetical protein
MLRPRHHSGTVHIYDGCNDVLNTILGQNHALTVYWPNGAGERRRKLSRTRRLLVGVAEEFTEQFSRDLPGFEGAYLAHLENEDGSFPHLFFAIDVVPATVNSFLNVPGEDSDWRLTLSYLEDKFAQHIPEINTVIVTSFLYQLPYEGQPGADIVYSLGPQMKVRLAEMRPSSAKSLLEGLVPRWHDEYRRAGRPLRSTFAAAET